MPPADTSGVRRRREGRDRVRGRHARPQVEFEEVVGMGALGEDAELGEG
jgi:hypothetical protein